MRRQSTILPVILLVLLGMFALHASSQIPDKPVAVIVGVRLANLEKK